MTEPSRPLLRPRELAAVALVVALMVAAVAWLYWPTPPRLTPPAPTVPVEIAPTWPSTSGPMPEDLDR